MTTQLTSRAVPPITSSIRLSSTSEREVVRIPPGYFGAPLGISGLAALWLFASEHFGAPAIVGNVIAIVAAVVWIGLMAIYVRQGPKRVLADFQDTALGPFFATPVMSALILGAILWPHAEGLSRVIVVTCLIVDVLLCGGLLGQWMTGGLNPAQYGPAIYLPGGGMNGLAAQAAAVIGLHQISTAFFGIEVVTWVLASAIILGQLGLRSRFADSLFPTLAIQLAVPAVAGSAWFVMGHGADGLSLGIAAYAAIMVVAQIRLVPLYLKLSFAPSFWAFTFPYIATAILALRWLVLEKPAGASAYAWILIALVTALTVTNAARSVRAVARGEILLSRYAMRVPSDGGCPPELSGGK